MTDRSFTAADFLRELERICNLEDEACLLLKIDNTKTWPHFCISGLSADSLVVQGYFVEHGTSYLQIAESGREVFTGTYRASTGFVDHLESIMHVLSTEGCLEVRWKDQAGKLIRSAVEIRSRDKKILFGKIPPFWLGNLTEERVSFDPFCARRRGVR